MGPLKWAEAKSKPLPAAVFPGSMCVPICELRISFFCLFLFFLIGPQINSFAKIDLTPRVALTCPHQ